MDMRGHNLPPMTGNWIAVSRDMRDHPVVGMGQNVQPADPSRGSYSRYEAWQDLLMEAKYKPFQAQNKGKTVTLQRGQLMAARAWLASRWNWSEKTVRGFIEKLEGEYMVRTESVKNQGPVKGQSGGQSGGQYKGQRSGHYSNVLTICNYDIYQTVLELMKLSEGQSEGQYKGQNNFEKGPDIKQETIKQEVQMPNGILSNVLDGISEKAPPKAKPKREKVAIPEEYPKDFDEFWKLYPRREGKAAAFTSWQRLTMPQKRKAYVALKSQIAALIQRAGDMRGNFCPLPATWINQGRFDDDLVACAVSAPAPFKPFDKQKSADEAWLDREIAQAKRVGLLK